MKLKKILFLGFFVMLFVMLFCIAASAEIYSGRALDEEFILSNARNGDLGYPATTELADGSLVTVHYQPYEQDLRTSIFFTKWRA